MSLGNLFLALFLVLLSLQLGLSVELPSVVWIGSGASLLAGFRIVSLERPTWGLVFVLLTAGGFLGNQILEDWAVEGSWAQSNGLGAGFVLSLLIYLIWLFAARSKSNSEIVLDRETQSILVFGLLLMLLLSPPDSTVVMLFGVPVALLTVIGILLASLVLIADRCAGLLLTRLLLLLPLVLLVPLMAILLGFGQGPVIAALGNIFPASSNYTPTGFSPYQQLRASVFLRPSNRAVMRIDADGAPNPYLAGNRLVRLSEELVWEPSILPRQSLSTFDAESLPTGELRYEIENHDFNARSTEAQSLTIHSLSNDNYIFVTPNTSHVTGRFGAMVRGVADVWTLDFDRGADRRWQLEMDSDPVPEITNDENLLLPVFWDPILQQKSQEFLGEGQQQTVDNVLEHFRGREYSLQTNFDPEQPLHDFFLNDRAGYCFWFATATTLALRANGIPSRLVGGYVIHEQLSSELWLVRERDAHSWVEWQDEAGFWHTIDPTPATIFGFFNGYSSSTLSVWYHTLAAQWQGVVDAILANELAANLIRYGGLLILAILFLREYRRIRGQREQLAARSLRWQKLWQRFLSISKLPANTSWTVGTYAENLPANWPETWKSAVTEFLKNYNLNRFSDQGERAIRSVEDSLEECSQVIHKT
jgi:hypothetical protein